MPTEGNNIFFSLTQSWHICQNKLQDKKSEAVQLEFWKSTVPPSLHFYNLSLDNIWYLSDEGSDDHDCHSEAAPCRNLQTVLDRAIDGADIYVTSETLSLDAECTIMTSTSVNMLSIRDSMVNMFCPGKLYIITRNLISDGTGNLFCIFTIF